MRKAMDKAKLRALLPTGSFEIAESCIVGAIAAVGLAAATAAPAAATPEQNVEPSNGSINAPRESVATQTDNAIMLNMVHTDAATGQQVVQHYSHASHASHESHYSSR